MDRNTLAVQQLKILGFPMKNIRQALPRLTGVEQYVIAASVGIARQYVTLLLSGERSTAKQQEAIARYWGIPRNILFEDILKQKAQKALDEINATLFNDNDDQKDRAEKNRSH